MMLRSSQYIKDSRVFFLLYYKYSIINTVSLKTTVCWLYHELNCFTNHNHWLLHLSDSILAFPSITSLYPAF